MKAKTIAIMTVMMMLTIGISFASDSDALTEYKHGDLLVDHGNGITEWIDTKISSTISSTVSDSLTAAGYNISITGGVITVDGLTSRTTGGADTGGTLSVPGTTGVVVTSSWHIYSWSNNTSKWTVVDPSEYDTPYSMHKMAVGFYPDGILPTVNPNYKTAWTMIAGDSENSINQTIETTDTNTVPIWQTHGDGSQMSAFGCYCGTMYADGMAVVKTGSLITCYDITDGDVVWDYEFTSIQIEMSCPLIAGGKVYVPTSAGQLFCIDLHDGPGPNGENVIKADDIPEETIELEFFSSYGRGPMAIVYNSGCLFLKAHNGMVYCFDSGLNLVWSYQMMGQAYYTALTVIDDYVFAGTYDGCLYILERETGSLIHKELVYQTLDSHDNKIGSCNVPMPVRYDDGYYLFMTYSDGQGMNSKVASLMLYRFETATNTLTKIKDFVDDTDMGFTCNMVTRYVTDDFAGAIVATYKGIFKVDTAGNVTLITKAVGYTTETHASPTLVNNEILYASTYATRELYELTVDGEILGKYSFDNKWYAMAIVTVVDGYIIRSDDNGITAFSGSKLTNMCRLSTKSLPRSGRSCSSYWRRLLSYLQ